MVAAAAARGYRPAACPFHRATGTEMPADRAALVLGLLAAPLAARPQDEPKVPADTVLSHIPIPTDQEGEQLVLTLAEAMKLGRDNNADLRARSYVPELAGADLRIAKSTFEPEFYSNAGFSRSKEQAQNIFQPSLTREIYSGTFGFRQRTVTGGLFDLSYAPVRLEQSAQIPGFPPTLYTNDLSISYRQPLLRDAWADTNLAGERRAEVALGASVHGFERDIQDLMLDIVRAYWELVFARENYRVVFASLELAQEQLRITLERIRVRELAERDRVADEANVARRQEELIRAENEIREREDALRRLLFDDSDGSLWRRTLVPGTSMRPQLEDAELDWRALARRALRDRPDLKSLRAQVALAEIEQRVAEQAVMPQLDLVTSYSTDGVAGHYDQSTNTMWHFEFPDWSVQLQFVLPIGNSAALAGRDRAQLETQRVLAELYAAELDVSRQVRQVVRNLRTLALTIRAGQESMRLAETDLDTERIKLRVGASTVFEVNRRIQALQESRTSLLRNVLDRRISEAELEHVQGLLLPPEPRRGDEGPPK
jgi:outer membrane protein TolC